jgi:trk system potassium uptake protein TrkA
VRVHVVVVGCGRVGSGLAMAMEGDGHSVAILDKNSRAFRRLPEAFKGQRLVGSGFDRDDLEAAGAVGADALAAVTSGDNTNILTVRIARENYGIARVVARIYDPRRAEIYQRLGIPTVATVTWTIEQVQRKLFPERMVSEWTDPTGRIQLVERALPVSWCGRRIQQIAEDSGAQIMAVTRGGITRLGAGDLVGQEGDILYLAVDRAVRDRIDGLLGPSDVHEPAPAVQS